jgi:hypothetical protein
VRKVDLSIELQILAFHAQRRAVVRVNGNGSAGGAPPMVPPEPAATAAPARAVAT